MNVKKFCVLKERERGCHVKSTFENFSRNEEKSIRQKISRVEENSTREKKSRFIDSPPGPHNPPSDKTCLHLLIYHLFNILIVSKVSDVRNPHL